MRTSARVVATEALLFEEVGAVRVGLGRRQNEIAELHRHRIAAALVCGANPAANRGLDRLDAALFLSPPRADHGVHGLSAGMRPRRSRLSGGWHLPSYWSRRDGPYRCRGWRSTHRRRGRRRLSAAGDLGIHRLLQPRYVMELLERAAIFRGENVALLDLR